MEPKTVIAPMGDHMDALFVGIREFPTRRVVLICPKEYVGEAEKAKKQLETFKIPTTIKKITGETYEGTFIAVADVTREEGRDNVIVNVATGDRSTRCAATSAAFVNGIKAFAVSGNMAAFLPVLKFNYYKLLSDKKLGIMKALYDKDKCVASLEELSKMTKMSLPLLSYHINGNLKSEGLKELGLVDTFHDKGRVRVCLNMQGVLIVRGYIPMEEA
ncbi:MAG: DUF6293 family protein [Candidatus Woesearchaeota archaeon]